MKSVKNKNLKIQFVDLSNESMAFNVLIDEKLVETNIYGTKNQIKQSRATKYALNNIDTVLSRTTNENALWIVIYDCGLKIKPYFTNQFCEVELSLNLNFKTNYNPLYKIT